MGTVIICVWAGLRQDVIGKEYCFIPQFKRSGDCVLLRKCYNSRNGLFGEEMFRNAGVVAGGEPGPHFFVSEVHINEIQI